jgi:lipopolysaccharide transport system permease protein
MNVEYYKDLLFELTKKEIKVRYKNSYLGYLWSLANPLFLAFIFYFIFKIVTKVQMEDYTLFLISGLFVWQWINNSIIGGANLYISNSSLIKKVNFPRNFLALSLVLSEGFNFLMSIPVIVFFVFYYNKTINIYWIYVPILIFITGVFIYSLTLLIATINLFFRDMERLITLLMTFIFYLTPIIYPISMVPQKYHFFLYFNPFFPLIMLWQEVFVYNDFSFKFLASAIFYDIIFFLISYIIYNKLKYKFAELV